MNRRAAVWFLVSIAVGLLMVSSESLWIDEGQTWLFARERSFSDWKAALLSNVKSEAQMPLGVFLAWLGARIIGEGEWQLRSLNVLWIGLAGVAMARLGQTLGRRELLPLFLAHPFAWYYANEARPYALIICASAWLLAVWAAVHERRILTTATLWGIGVVAALGLAASLLFSFALVGFGFALGATMLARKIHLDRRHLLPIATTAVAMAAVMAYYVWTLTRGASGAKIWTVGLSNVAFAFYELLGFGGLGPPRHELRELARSSGGISFNMLHERHWIGIAMLAGAYLALARPLWRLRRDSLAMILAGAVALSTAGMFCASLVVGFPFWGRHLAFLLPPVVLLISKAASQIRHEFSRRSLILLLLACLIVSSLSQRFLAQYRKDDYRSAAQMAKVALGSGKTVWWVANHVTAEYYSLRAASDKIGQGRVIWFNAENARDTENQPAPDLIFLSKPDVHDIGNKVLSYIDAQGYRRIAELAAFRIYSRTVSGQECAMPPAMPNACCANTSPPH